jgi:hypothetical protein
MVGLGGFSIVRVFVSGNARDATVPPQLPNTSNLGVLMQGQVLLLSSSLLSESFHQNESKALSLFYYVVFPPFICSNTLYHTLISLQRQQDG